MLLETLVRKLRPLAVGLSLALSPMYSCSPDNGDDSKNGPCMSDSECKGDRICVEGYCQGNTGNEGGSGGYNCETGPKMFLETCCSYVSCEGKTYEELAANCRKSEQKGYDVASFYACVEDACQRKVPSLASYIEENCE